MILILDASNRSSFIALVKEAEVAEVIDIEHLNSTLPLSQTLYPSLAILLQRNSLTPRDLKKVVYGRGPGSFLGIRTAANLASAFHCSLGVEVGSFMSPLAYLPFIKGKFAYAMRPKGGKYPVIIGVKDGDKTEVLASHLLENFEDLREFAKHSSIQHFVYDAGIEKEITPYISQLACTTYPQKMDIAFLPILAKTQNPKKQANESMLQEQNAFELVYS